MSRPLAWLLTLDAPDDPQPFANHLRVVEMARALGRLGFALQTITPATRASDRRPPGIEGAERIEHPVAPAAAWRPPGWDPLWFRCVVVPWLARLRRRHEPRWIFTNAAAYAPVVAQCAAAGSGRPVVHVDVMGLGSLERAGLRRGARGVLARRLVLRDERAMCRAADVITTVNDRHARTITELFAPRVAPAVIRDACDPMDVTPIDLQAMGIRSGTTVIAFLGQLMHGRLDDLLRAMERLPSSLPVQALIIGDGPDRPGDERRVAESDRLRGRVVFVGFRERRVGLAMVAASAIAFSDCWSAAGFPFKLFEYMALGRAIVVEGKEQMREVLSDGEDASFYRGADALAAAITALVEDPPRRQRLGVAARARFEAHHTLARRRRELDALLATHAAGDATA